MMGFGVVVIVAECKYFQGDDDGDGVEDKVDEGKEKL